MSEQDAYTEAEWAILVEAPVAVIAAVIGASPSGPIGITQEIGAAVRSFEQAAATRRANPLIAGLLVTLKGLFEQFTGKPAEGSAPPPDIVALGQHPERAVAALSAANELLVAKAPPPLADELRDWLLDLAQVVAAAAAEGGFLGIGGEPVSPSERAILAEIATALGRSETREV